MRQSGKLGRPGTDTPQSSWTPYPDFSRETFMRLIDLLLAEGADLCWRVLQD